MVLNLLVRSALQSATNRVCLLSRAAIVPRPLGCGTDLRDDHIYPSPVGFADSLINFVQARGAARKGKRIERNRQNKLRAAMRRQNEKDNPKSGKKKRRVKIDQTQYRFNTVRQYDTTKPEPPRDDVYFVDRFRPRRFSLDEILEFHRQAVHPDIFNEPDALVSATLELNLKMKIKKKKYIEKIESTLCYPHLFKHSIKPRKIVALCQKPEDQEAAKEAGAVMAGAMDIALQLKSKQLTERDFDHLVCHTGFLTEFAAVKTMKTQPYFPNKARGNFGENMKELVKFFKDGIDYNLIKLPDEPEYGFVECYFGRLNMTNDQLKENLLEFFRSVNRFKPLNLADNKQFFQRVTISTPATDEIFLLKFWELIDEYQDPDALIAIEEEQAEKKAAGA